MAKRKITVTVDEQLVEEARRLGETSLSAVVNDALAAEIDRLARRAALKDLLDGWDAVAGPPSERATRQARAAFDELDGIAIPPDASSSERGSARGAA
jgi:hypothetical protein